MPNDWLQFRPGWSTKEEDPTVLVLFRPDSLGLSILLLEGVLVVDLRLAVAVKSEGRRLINIACVKPLIKFFEVGRHKSLIFFQLSRLGAKP